MTKTTNPNTTYTLQLRKKNHNPHEKSFETTLIEAVDAALALFGQHSKQVIYFHIEKTYNIKKQEIPHKIKEFADAIEQIFGEGAKLIEIKIIEALHKRIQDFVYFPRKGELTFTEYIADMRAFLKLQKL